MRTLTASRWILVWGLAWHCMQQLQCASTHDLSKNNGLLDLECEMLPVENCAFAIGARGFRCVLENAVDVDGSVSFECLTLTMELQPGRNAGRLGLQLGSRAGQIFGSAYIESNECITTCGLQRLTVGFSTDDILHNNDVLEKLCSPNCKLQCLNIIDHYQLVLAESGEHLTRVCQDILEYIKDERAKPHDIRTELHVSRQELKERAPGPSSNG